MLESKMRHFSPELKEELKKMNSKKSLRQKRDSPLRKRSPKQNRTINKDDSSPKI